MKMSFTRWATRTDLTKGAVTRRSVIGTPLLQAQQAATKAPEPPPFDGDVTADGAKMSVVVVNDLTDLEKYVAAWEDLAAAAIEPNVFYEPWMLMPALRAYGVDRRSLFALVLAPDPARPLGPPLLCGFFPLELRDHYDGTSIKLPLKTLSLWRKPEMTYLCAPLLRAGYGREALAAFFDWLDACSHNCSLMEFGFVPGEGPFHQLMVDYLHSHVKFTHVAESFTRALFRPASDTEVYIRSALSRARRKEYRRQERRLAETGRLEYKALGPGADADAWIEEFLEFEAKSWKGKGGRALVCDEIDRKYFVEVAREAFRRGKLMMLALCFNGRPIAYKLNFLSGAGAFAFKIAFDEEYARYSPGVLLELENIRLLHERPQIKWMDSCADPDRFMINHLWNDRRVIQTVVVSAGKPQGDLALAAIPLLKWGNRRIFRRDLLERKHLQITKRDLLTSDEAGSDEALMPRLPRLLEIDGEAFRAGFNRASFLIKHHLADHPLFSLRRLVELASRLPEEKVKYNGADISVATGLYEGPRTGLSVQETIRRIEECRSWMVINNVELDPEYRQLLDRCLDEVQLFSEPIDPGMFRREGFIFISSPHSITPFHMDPEYNFLLQVRGEKRISIWDNRDRSVLSEIALERYFSNAEKQIVFKEEYQQKASIFELTPGAGLHFPVVAPHWVRNGDDVSVSFSITFRTPASERQRIVYCANASLRKRGLNPKPHGASAFRDLAKYYAFRAGSGIKRLLV
jgi:hypothetical protein